MQTESYIIILIWAVGLLALTSGFNAKNIISATANFTIAAFILFAAGYTTHIYNSPASATEEAVLETEAEAEIEAAPAIAEEPETQPIIEEQAQAPAPKRTRTRVEEQKPVSKAYNPDIIQQFVSQARSLVNKGDQYASSLKKFDLDNIDYIEDKEYEEMAKRAVSLQKKINSYVAEVNSLKAPNKHGLSFKETLVQAAKDMSASVNKLCSFINADTDEDEESLVKLHYSYMKEATEGISDLKKSF